MYLESIEDASSSRNLHQTEVQKPPKNETNTVLQSKSESRCSTSSYIQSELFELMQEFRIESMYDTFNEYGVTVDEIWKLDDEMINDMNLNKLQKLKYRTAKEKFTKNEYKSYQM